MRSNSIRSGRNGERKSEAPPIIRGKKIIGKARERVKFSFFRYSPKRITDATNEQISEIK
jgi:hypothetical protein